MEVSRHSGILTFKWDIMWDSLNRAGYIKWLDRFSRNVIQIKYITEVMALIKYREKICMVTKSLY